MQYFHKTKRQPIRIQTSKRVFLAQSSAYRKRVWRYVQMDWRIILKFKINFVQQCAGWRRVFSLCVSRMEQIEILSRNLHDGFLQLKYIKFWKSSIRSKKQNDWTGLHGFGSEERQVESNQQIYMFIQLRRLKVSHCGVKHQQWKTFWLSQHRQIHRRP
jgi:hypothetical protein